jgi:hypothetical protein
MMMTNRLTLSAYDHILNVEFKSGTSIYTTDNRTDSFAFYTISTTLKQQNSMSAS